MTQGSVEATVPRRYLLFALALATLASLAMTIGPARAAADPNSCPDSWGCIWGQDNYDGQRTLLDGSLGGVGWIYFTDYTRSSAKNRFGSRKLKVGRTFDGENFTAIACLDPNEDRPDPGWFNSILVGANGSQC
jgi:hypothetical protein